MNLKNTINQYLRKLNMEVHGLGYLKSLEKGDFKSDEFQFFKRHFNKKNIVIFDVGANRGSMIQRYLELFPSCRIYAFEPHAPFFATLEADYGANPNIFLNQQGIYHQNGTVDFHINKGADTNSILASGTMGLNCDKQVKTVSKTTIPVTTIDRYATDKGINHIHLLKLDIQGGELSALRGAENFLKEGKIDMIYTEVFFKQQYIDQPLFPQIAIFLSRFGYELQDFYNPFYGKSKLVWSDAVFVHREFKI